MELQKYKLKEVTSELHGGDTISAKDIYIYIYTEGDYPVFGGNGHRGYTNNWNQDGSYVIIGRQSDPSVFAREGIMQNDSFAIIDVKF